MLARENLCDYAVGEPLLNAVGVPCGD